MRRKPPLLPVRRLKQLQAQEVERAPPVQPSVAAGAAEVGEQPAAETSVLAEGFLTTRGASEAGAPLTAPDRRWSRRLYSPPLRSQRPLPGPPLPSRPSRCLRRPGRARFFRARDSRFRPPCRDPANRSIPFGAYSSGCDCPGAPSVPRSHARATLAGQPAAHFQWCLRVRPGRAARSAACRAGATQPRVARPASAPIYGQPIYQGQFVLDRPSRPAGPAARTARGKTTHPHFRGPVGSARRRPDRATTARREATGQAVGRERQADREEDPPAGVPPRAGGGGCRQQTDHCG